MKSIFRSAFVILFFPSLALGSTFNVGVDVATGDVIEISTEGSGTQHLVDKGYSVVSGVHADVASLGPSKLIWVDLNVDSSVQSNEIVARTAGEEEKYNRQRRRKLAIAIISDIEARSVYDRALLTLLIKQINSLRANHGQPPISKADVLQALIKEILNGEGDL